MTALSYSIQCRNKKIKNRKIKLTFINLKIFTLDCNFNLLCYIKGRELNDAGININKLQLKALIDKVRFKIRRA